MIYTPSPLVRGIDNVIAALAPAAALRRKIARSKLHSFRYEAAVTSRARGSTNQALAHPESPTYSSDRVRLIREARDLVENSELAAGLRAKFIQYTIGSVRYQSRTGTRATDQRYEEYFTNWAQSCDVTGRHSARKMFQLCLSGALTDGDVGMAIARDNTRVMLAGIESDRIGDPNSQTNSETYFSGLTLDPATKRITSFRVYERTMNGNYRNPVEIPASAFVHLLNPRRFDEFRGISAFHPVINCNRDIKEIIDFEKLAVKWASAQAGVVTNATGAPDPSDFFANGTEAGSGTAKRESEISPGRLNYLMTGEDFKQFNIDRPGAAWQGFLQFLIRLYATGLNLGYGFVFDMSGLTGPAARFESEQARRTFGGWQLDLQEKVLDRVKNVVIANGIAHDGLPADPNWMRGVWQFPAHPSIDIGRESAADLNENRQGIKSMDTILGPQNLDGEEERIKIAQECKHWLELSEEYEVPVEMMRRMTMGGAEMPTTPAPEQPEVDDDEDIAAA